MGSSSPKLKRCAVYTRKSSEEGLEQDFNSLDAQRESCLAFIQSQKSEGWKPVRAQYDDGGYSGGNLNRPALTQLLADIESNLVDTVVVYKVDRLTRSLSDFAKIVEVLDSNGASFVSVTQQFNTTTSMGRLTLNMLLSFAQFEREVTGERIRDKIAASKRKGLWMGGRVPLGYRANGRTLEIERDEASTVRLLFSLYLELESVRRLKQESDQRGLRTKVYTDKNGKISGGLPFGRGSLYHLLSNPIYVGRVPHKEESHEGQHEAIVEVDTWEAVQRKFSEQAPPVSRTNGEHHSSPLRGKLFDESGVRLTPSHTVKSGRRYRYYVSRPNPNAASLSSGNNHKPRWRLPGREIERFVEQSVLELMRSPEHLARLARFAQVSQNRLPSLLEQARSGTHAPLNLVERVELTGEEIMIQIGLTPLLSGQTRSIRYAVPARIRRRGVEQKLVLPPGAGSHGAARGADPSLLRLIARSRHWFESIASGQASSFKQIAEAEGVSEQFVGNRISLAFLAPQIVESICAGTQREDLTTEALVKRIEIPRSWSEQAAQLQSGGSVDY